MKIKTISLVLAAVMLMGSALSAFASEEEIETDQPRVMSFIDELIEDGIITEEQKTLIEEKRETRRAAALQERYTDVLTEGIITQEKLDDVIAFMDNFHETRKTEMEVQRELIADMTEEERKAYFESKECVNPVDQMVEEGLLTEEEAVEISKVIGAGPRNGNLKRSGMGKGNGNGMKQRPSRGNELQQSSELSSQL